jgi:hypothetical protein
MPRIGEQEAVKGAIREARKPRQDKGKMRWTERDLAVVRWIGEQYAVRQDQLAIKLARLSSVPTQAPGVLREDTVYKLVTRWKQAGVVEMTALLRQQPSWVWLTHEGLEQMDLPYRFWKPKVQGLAHLYAVNQARLWIEQRAPTAIWRSERQLAHERGFMRKQAHGPHRPDAEVESDGQRMAVEVELSEKVSGRLAAILYELARTYMGIWYFCSPATQALMQRAVAALNPPALRQKFAIVPLRLEGSRRTTPTGRPTPRPQGTASDTPTPTP